jgi:hypothetical protein
VAAQLRSSGRWDAEEAERRLRQVYQSHGAVMPPGLPGWSRLVAETHAWSGTRNLRLLWMAARGISGVLTWAWRGTADADPVTEHNRAQARAGFRSVGVMAAGATTITVAASRSSGWPRRLLGSAALVIWLATGWAGVLVTGVAALSRLAARDGNPIAGARDTEF